MTPLLIAGATTVAKYLASRDESVGPSRSGGAVGNFDSVLRGAMGGSVSVGAEVGDLQSKMISSPEVASALKAVPQGVASSLVVGQNGAISLVMPSGQTQVVAGDGTRALALQFYSKLSRLSPQAVSLDQATGLSSVKVALSAGSAS